MKDIVVIKIGGILLNNNIILNQFFSILLNYFKTCNKNILIVHGGESLFSQKMKKINFYNLYNKDKKYLYDIYQNNELLKISFLSGIISKKIMQYSYINNINGINLNITDGNDIILDIDENNSLVNYNYKSMCFIRSFFDRNIIPIISPIGFSNNNKLISIDSDVVSMIFSISLKAQLIILTDISAVLDGKGNEIKKINKNLFYKLVSQGVITDGMILKIQSALNVVQKNNIPVIISSLWYKKNIEKLFLQDVIGTSIF